MAFSSWLVYSHLYWAGLSSRSMFRWRWLEAGVLSFTLLVVPRLKKYYIQRYEKTLMRWGSGLFWVYAFQCLFGVLLVIGHANFFDSGLPAVLHLWWETSHGSFLVRLHSEFGNLIFLFLFSHVLTKLWTSVDSSDSDGYISWISGSLLFIFSYVAGVTGAIMPCSTLSEVTATIVGSGLGSLVFVKFDFLEVLLVPGMALNDDSFFRSYVVHALVPLLSLGLGFLHMSLLHRNKYSGAGGFKRLPLVPRFRATRRWLYASYY